MGMGFLENIEHTWDEGFSFPKPEMGIPNQDTHNRVLEHFEEMKRRSTNRYLITTLRDNEPYVRSALFFDNPIDAVEGYNRYQDRLICCNNKACKGRNKVSKRLRGLT